MRFIRLFSSWGTLGCGPRGCAFREEINFHFRKHISRLGPWKKTDAKYYHAKWNIITNFWMKLWASRFDFSPQLLSEFMKFLNSHFTPMYSNNDNEWTYYFKTKFSHSFNILYQNINILDCEIIIDFNQTFINRIFENKYKKNVANLNMHIIIVNWTII